MTPDQSSHSHDSIDWHALTADEVAARLDVDALTGLSTAEAKRRLDRIGANRLPLQARRAAWLRFLMQFRNNLIYVLLGAAVITALFQHLWQTVVIFAVVIVSVIIGFIQQSKAEKAIHKMLAPHATVLRDGVQHRIAGEELVPGDIVLLAAGDRVPADLRLLTVNRLQIQEAILTGESVPVEKMTPPVVVGAALGNRNCMAFSGTLVTAGQATGIVVATGSRAEIGRISSLLSALKR